MILRVLLCLWLLGHGLAFGEPRLRCRAEAHAPEYSLIRPIAVDVIISNDAKETCEDIEVSVYLSPERMASRIQRDASAGESSPFEPVELRSHVDALYGGRTRKLTLATPYYAASGFHNDFGYFMVENLIPNLRRTVIVHYRVSLKVQGTPLTACEGKIVGQFGPTPATFLSPPGLTVWNRLCESGRGLRS